MTLASTPEEREKIRKSSLRDEYGFDTDDLTVKPPSRGRAARGGRRRDDALLRRRLENEARYQTRSADQILAATYAQGYAGNFAYMTSMRARAIQYGSHWTPTEREAAAILRCRAHDRRQP